MANVGIMSMQRIANYGSFLQAYALRTMLEELGHDVQFVDYHVCPPVIRDASESDGRLARTAKKGLAALGGKAPLSQRLAFIRHKKNFAQRYMPLLGVTERPNYNPQLDCLVIGSDEVFNCIQKNTNVGFSPELFGADSQAKRVITYAASFGNTTLEKLDQYGKTEEIANYLRAIDAVSVRDANSGAIVNALTGSTPEYHLDPVLAYDYMGKCDRIPNLRTDEKYLILYAYSNRITEAEGRWIAEYAKQRGLKVYAIGGAQPCADRFIDCSPFEVLAYFKNAEAVITDTFHGTIFSVITHRPFATLVRKSVGTGYGNEEKLTDLLRRLNLSSRATYDIANVKQLLEQHIDFDATDAIIAEQRQHTFRYLSKEIALHTV
ncbi:Polysaccharide pyruvyl transferase [Bifidobacterium eulemuris]|uniref:Polysaccharide pyruvyl transferase n=3 Tax=Bifidobacterium eulemuris TaxID=1765219 RepID=A0A261G5A6_9BIFI|nr:Polysaccharide pyruvyl transferase [Bifidobacterium eulemuris]